MTAKANQLLEDAMQLPEKDRADLAAQLIESLDTAVDDDADAAWEAEISRRLAEMDAGKAVMVPWSKLRRRILGKFDAQ